MKKVLKPFLVLFILLTMPVIQANPIMLFYINELRVSADNFELELDGNSVYTLDGWYLTSSTDTAYFKTGLNTDKDFLVFTRDSLQKPLAINRYTDVFSLNAPYGPVDQIKYGNQDYTQIGIPHKSVHSICLKVYYGITQNYYYYYDSTPTFGTANDSSGAMGYLAGNVSDTSGTPISGFKINYNYLEYDWDKFNYDYVITDSEGNFIIHDMARLLKLYYGNKEKEDEYLTEKQIYPADTVSVQIVIDRPTAIDDGHQDQVITGFELKQNYPNPFNSSTIIRYKLPGSGKVTLRIYDTLGKHIRTLDEGLRNAGEHSVTFDASGLPGGIYFYKLSANGQTISRRMLLIK